VINATTPELIDTGESPYMKLRQSRRIRSVVVASLLVLGAGAGLASASLGSTASAATASSASAPKTTIRYQDTAGLLNYAQLAKALGYLPDITLQNVGSVTGGPAALQDLATGQIDYVSVAFTGAIENAISKGNKLEAVISVLGSGPSSYDALISKKGENLSTPKSWIGKKIAVNTLGAQAQAILDTWFQRGGLTAAQIKQVTLVPLPTLSEEAALEHGQVQGAILIGAPLAVALSDSSIGVAMKDISVFGPYNGDQYAMSDAWLKAHASAAKEFIGGMAKAAYYTQSHTPAQVLAKLDPWLKANGLSADATALAKWTTLGLSTKGGYVKAGDFTKWIPWLKSQHLIKSTPNVNSMFTNAYNPYAPAS
jgi:ABC-type nitrate/sulfonate/bicarbonate transport system substrate-binding protein